MGTPKTDLIPRSVLLGNPERVGVQLSPDGTQLSWIAPLDGVMNIWVAPVGKLDQAKAITHETVRPIRSYQWAFTNKHVLYPQDTAGDENFHVFKVDVTDGKITDLTPYPGARAELLGLSPKQPAVLIAGVNDRDPEATDLRRIDIVTGTSARLVENTEGMLSYTLDHQLAPRLAVKKLASGETELYVNNARTGAPAWKLWDTIAFEDGDTTQIIGIAPDGKAAYVQETRGRDTGALVSIDLASKKSKLIAEDPKSDVAGVIVHPTKHTLQAVAFNYERIAWKVLDTSIQRDLAALAKLDGGEVSIVSRTVDDKRWIAVTSSDRSPARYYLWDRAPQKATFLFAAQPALEQQPLVKMHPVVIDARDGLKLVSYLTLPAAADPDGDGKANAPVPAVLLVHGGPWGRDEWGYNPYHQLLANRGYAVLSVNFRASTGFGKKFMNAGNLQWGKAMHDDLLDAVAWLVAQGVAPKDKIAIMGGSYGGYATLAGLAMTPDVFACGVDIVGPSNLLTLLGSIPPYWAPFLAFLKSRMGDPDTAEGKALLVQASPLTHAKHIRRPLLIGQGANDPRVKQAESEQILAAMKQHGLPVTYAVFPDEGHGFARPVNNIAFTAIAEAFLSAHLGGVYLPATAAELSASTMQLQAGREGIPGI
ncbi:MAG TPA: S9 family peptidase [Kofleriaceae bacterium]|nr:S9 family peptidase [Kofleriaceae bacterium]